MPTFRESLGDASSIVTIVGGLAGLLGTASLAGCLPRAGPGRAIGLALFPVLRNLEVVSKRTDIVDAIRQEVHNLNPKTTGYLVVVGPKGVGKSTAILTAMHRSTGVVTVAVPPGETFNNIVANVSRKLANVHSTWVHPEWSARRTIFFYRMFTFGRFPTVILQLNEREPTKECADITGTARFLASMGLKVLVDASPNAIPSTLLTTQREQVIAVEPMPDDILKREFDLVCQSAGAAGLAPLVMASIGGVAARARQLQDGLTNAKDSEQAQQLMRSFIVKRLADAIRAIDAQVRAIPELEELYKKFQDEDRLPMRVHSNVKLPDPDKVLRQTFIDGEWWLVPSNPVLGLMLRNDLRKVPELEVLHQLLEKSRVSSASS